ncbi:site-specific recombinase [Rhizobacter sp. Root404]|uniref:site-specific recombinase n=1 Tax=Rhizobacter sp. Root404 TaxID=1736528 RepID=UPI0006F5C870|nr:site-specific recombinase [Rhizobacter sp. Root404]KQW35141.1 recombinase [Rhizobacter sp. Root404]
MAKGKGGVSHWDLTALLNAADPKAGLPERHLWLIRLLEWLRHAPVDAPPRAEATTPMPVLRLKHLLGVLDRHPEHHERVTGLLRRIWAEVDNAALLADFGFAPRMDLWGELGRRLRARVLPLTPATTDLGELFALLFPDKNDAAWLLAIDNGTLERLRTYVAPVRGTLVWRHPFLDAIVFLASAVRAAGFSPALRQRMSAELLVNQPFRQLARVAEQFSDHAQAADASSEAALLQEAQYLRALLDQCRRCAESVHEHLEAHGVSVDVVFEVDQLRERTHRIDALLTCVISPEPAREITRLIANLVQVADDGRSIRGLMSSHYSLLARKVAERSAETGQHYITRDMPEYRRMLRAAAGGGSVLAATTFIKFAVLALALSPFWGGFWAGVNYAASFVLIQLLHFTVATKQPAMTAPAMAEKLADLSSDENVEGFVDEVAQLIRSQAAGIFGNLALVAPIVLAVQLGWQAAFGAPLVGHRDAQHVLESLTLLGPTALFAAFTGVLLFASSLIAGWVENWFVWHRLDSAIAWNPRIVARLGARRAARWGAYWRANISGFASNTSLGMMLGVLPVVALFFGVPLEVRHVTLSTGQVAAAVGAEGVGLMATAPFWWCVAGIAVTGVLNLTVSFLMAFRVALRSRGIRLVDRSRIYRAIRARLWHRPLSFIWPTR